jgi:hypothetical protein
MFLGIFLSRVTAQPEQGAKDHIGSWLQDACIKAKTVSTNLAHLCS